MRCMSCGKTVVDSLTWWRRPAYCTVVELSRVVLTGMPTKWIERVNYHERAIRLVIHICYDDHLRNWRRWRRRRPCGLECASRFPPLRSFSCLFANRVKSSKNNFAQSIPKILVFLKVIVKILTNLILFFFQQKKFCRKTGTFRIV